MSKHKVLLVNEDLTTETVELDWPDCENKLVVTGEGGSLKVYRAVAYSRLSGAHMYVQEYWIRP